MVDIYLNLSRQELEDAITILDMLCLTNLLDDHKKKTRELLLSVLRDVWKKELGTVSMNCPTCNKPLDNSEMFL